MGIQGKSASGKEVWKIILTKNISMIYFYQTVSKNIH
jgi:hypothetical protein